MVNRYAAATDPAWPLEVCVKKMWAVEADGSYDITNTRRTPGEYISILTLGGQGLAELAGGEETLTRGEVLVAPRRDILRYCCTGEGWNFFWTEFTARAPLPCPLRLADGAVAQSGETHRRMFDALAVGQAGYVSSLFAGVLAGWLPKAEDRAGPAPGLVMEAVRHIQAAPIGENITVARLARLCGVSEKTLRTAFHRRLGMAPKQYILDKKLAAGKTLMATTDQSLGEISEVLGFSSQYHFSKVFKSRYGVPPQEYRRGFL